MPSAQEAMATAIGRCQQLLFRGLDRSIWDPERRSPFASSAACTEIAGEACSIVAQIRAASGAPRSAGCRSASVRRTGSSGVRRHGVAPALRGGTNAATSRSSWWKMRKCAPRGRTREWEDGAAVFIALAEVDLACTFGVQALRLGVPLTGAATRDHVDEGYGASRAEMSHTDDGDGRPVRSCLSQVDLRRYSTCRISMPSGSSGAGMARTALAALVPKACRRRRSPRSRRRTPGPGSSSPSAR